MNRILEMFGAFATEMNKHPSSKSSKGRSSRKNLRGRKRNDRGPVHFYDPDVPDSREPSPDGMEFSELKRRQAETWARIEELEAPLAREKKRAEQLEYRRRDCDARERQRREQQKEEPFLSPRDKNRKAFEREVARVERDALNAREALERRFAHSDKLFELRMARQGMESNEQREREATRMGMGHQPQNREAFDQGRSFGTEAESSHSAEQRQREAERKEMEYQPQDEGAFDTAAQGSPSNVRDNVPGQYGIDNPDKNGQRRTI